jgi:hypothetical protein
MNDYRLGRYGPDPAIAQKSVDSRDIAQRLDVFFHHGSPNVACWRRPAFLYICPQNCKRCARRRVAFELK